MTRKVVAIIQARVSSTRLPGKVLQPLCGIPMIEFMWRRVQRATLIDEIVLATSVEASDDLLAEHALRRGVSCHRGDLDDVLGRFEGAARNAGAEIVVRLTGDCPLIDPTLIDKAIRTLREHALDYVSNGDPPTFADGLDVEVFTFDALSRAHLAARKRSDREHVTPYIRNAKAEFRQQTLRSVVDMSALRWTVDHADDLALVRELVAGFADLESALGADRFDYLRVIERRSDLANLNPHGRNEGYAKSIANDAVITFPGDPP